MIDSINILTFNSSSFASSSHFFRFYDDDDSPVNLYTLDECDITNLVLINAVSRNKTKENDRMVVVVAAAMAWRKRAEMSFLFPNFMSC